MANPATESSPLLPTSNTSAPKEDPSPLIPSSPNNDIRWSLFQFLEARTPAGKRYEKFTILLILLSILSFVLGTTFVPKYNSSDSGIFPCGKVCDALWFGNDSENGLAFLQLGPTSVLEVVTVLIFTIDYLLRLICADLLDPQKFSGLWGRIKFLPTFYSLVDLASTLPFYIDAFLLLHTNLSPSQFLRMFRLFRMAKVEGRYDTAMTMLDNVFYEQRGILGTALFVGTTVWVMVAALYYFVERRSHDMIYCGGVPDDVCDSDQVDVNLCVINEWGIVDCTDAGCPPSLEYPEPCYNLFRSIPSAFYFSLLNLFGEFPLIDQHSPWGKAVGTLVAVVAVAVFALPAGIIGNGFEDVLGRYEEQRKEEAENRVKQKEEEALMKRSNAPTLRGKVYNFLFDLEQEGIADVFEKFINLLVLGCAIAFFFESTSLVVPDSNLEIFLSRFEFVSVVIFTIEFLLQLYAVSEDTRFSGLGGRLRYCFRFVPFVCLLSFLPYWIMGCVAGSSSLLVKYLRLLRILGFERYTRAFTTFDDVIRENLDVLAMTGFTALIMWILFSAILYFTERDNPDGEMASYYNNVPNAMWMTLLNLSGESPLCHYSTMGKVTTGIIGLFASGLFGIPIGVLGAGFENIAASEARDTPDIPDPVTANSDRSSSSASELQQTVYCFVNGLNSPAAALFEASTYIFIVLTVLIGILQTVEGQEDTFHALEWIAVIFFTVEYCLRVYSAAADKDYGGSKFKLLSSLKYMLSFYGLVDLAAVVPMYLAAAFPNGWFDRHDEYLRMLRLFRLAKLDKFVPSISLLDDVVRLKRNSLLVTGYAACTLWVLFSGLIYIAEHNDYDYGIDDVPSYGCYENCTMANRFRNMFDSFIYTGIHLTGDYPIVEYSPWGRLVCFFMVIAAVGVVSLPSGLIASGFAEIVETKTKSNKHNEISEKEPMEPGDDWYEFQLSRLKRSNTPPPQSRFGPAIDSCQVGVHEFLNGRTDPKSGITSRTIASNFGRAFMFILIVANVLAVLMESIPEIDLSVGNESGNFFDKFEAISVAFFGLEYVLRLFSASKNPEALYSPWVYATTFFGIVDFVSTAPWFLEQALLATGNLSPEDNNAKIFRIFRIARLLQLEDFIVAFSKLDNVFRASKDVLKATGLMATIIWVGCGALFFIFEQNNPNWRECDESIPSHSEGEEPGCLDFSTTAQCNDFYGDDMCRQTAFVNMPDSLYFTAVFLVGEWGLVDFTWPGRLVCLFLCVAGIAIYAIPTGTFFDSFGAVLGMGGDDDDGDEEGEP